MHGFMCSRDPVYRFYAPWTGFPAFTMQGKMSRMGGKGEKNKGHTQFVNPYEEFVKILLCPLFISNIEKDGFAEVTLM